MAITNGTTVESDGPASIEDLVEEIRPLLIAAGIDEERQAKILADIADDEEGVASRAQVRRRFRAAARRHGVRLASIAAGLTRYEFFIMLSGLSKLPTMYINAGQRLHLLDALDELAAEREARKRAKTDAHRDMADEKKTPSKSAEGRTP
jgi:hypothetical protein